MWNIQKVDGVVVVGNKIRRVKKLINKKKPCLYPKMTPGGAGDPSGIPAKPGKGHRFTFFPPAFVFKVLVLYVISKDSVSTWDSVNNFS